MDCSTSHKNRRGPRLNSGPSHHPGPSFDEKSQISSEDIAAEIKPFPFGLLEPQQYGAAVAEFVYLPVHGVEVLKYPRGRKCLALIEIPPQDDDEAPFLLNRAIDPDGKEFKVFAWPVRDGSHTRWQPIGRVHRDIADGRRSRRIERVVTTESAPADQTSEHFESRLTDDLTEIENYMGWQDSAIYALAAAPVSPTHPIEGIYGGEIERSFANPPMLRYAGFGLGYSNQLAAEHGGLMAVDADFRYRRLEPDGYLVVALRADEEILGRTRRPPTGKARPLTVNVIALVEFTYEFCRFHTTILRREVPSAWQLALLVRGAKSRPWSLRLGLPWMEMDWLRPSSHGRGPHSDEWLKVIEAEDDHAANAYQLLTHMCDLFGQTVRELPLVGDGRVNEQAIKDLN